MNHYTVMLLRPEYLSDNFGQDTYLAHVVASGPNSAAIEGQRAAWKADFEVDGDGDDADADPNDYHVLFVCRGHQDDLKP